MELKIDPNKTYAIALEGGGARGAYQVGAWRALDEVGIRYNAVSGSSVGALNGAMMAMRDRELAEKLWLDMRFSRVLDVDDDIMQKLFKKDFSGLSFDRIKADIKRLAQDRGFDATPLRNMIAEYVDPVKVRESGVDFYISTYSVTDKEGLDLRASELSSEELCNMLLASAYFPVFKHEMLGGKKYTDGGAFNVFPLSPLIENNYQNIIAIRLYGLGVEKRVKIPENTAIHTIEPHKSLGNMLNFSADSCRENFKLGYYDALRTLYGLYGEKYYIDRTMTEADAYYYLARIVRRHYAPAEGKITLRRLHEKLLPKLGRELSEKGDYYDMLVALMEAAATKYEIDEFEVMTDRALLERLYEISKKRRTGVGIIRYLSGGKWYEKKD